MPARPRNDAEGVIPGRKLHTLLVMPGLVPGIHVFLAFRWGKTWMAGTSPAMTT